MVTKSLVEVPFSVHGLIFIESVRGPLLASFGLNLQNYMIWGLQGGSAPCLRKFGILPAKI